MKILIEIGKQNKLEKRLDFLLDKVSRGEKLTKQELKEVNVLSQAEDFLESVPEEKK